MKAEAVTFDVLNGSVCADDDHDVDDEQQKRKKKRRGKIKHGNAVRHSVLCHTDASQRIPRRRSSINQNIEKKKEARRRIECTPVCVCVFCH